MSGEHTETIKFLNAKLRDVNAMLVLRVYSREAAKKRINEYTAEIDEMSAIVKSLEKSLATLLNKNT